MAAVGALLWVVSEIAVSQLTGPWTALAISIGAYLRSGAAAFVAASDVRPRVRTMAAMLVTGHYEPTSRATCERLQTLAATLVAADERLDRGQISAIDPRWPGGRCTARWRPPHRSPPFRRERVVAESLQMLTMMAAPAAILLTIRSIIVRQARQAAEPAKRFQSAVRRA